jgi:hypothetical protein
MFVIIIIIIYHVCRLCYVCAAFPEAGGAIRRINSGMHLKIYIQ